MTYEGEDCTPGDGAHRWPEFIDKADSIEVWHCDFCGDNWEEEEGERLKAGSTA